MMITVKRSGCFYLRCVHIAIIFAEFTLTAAVELDLITERESPHSDRHVRSMAAHINKTAKVLSI